MQQNIIHYSLFQKFGVKVTRFSLTKTSRARFQFLCLEGTTSLSPLQAISADGLEPQVQATGICQACLHREWFLSRQLAIRTVFSGPLRWRMGREEEATREDPEVAFCLSFMILCKQALTTFQGPEAELRDQQYSQMLRTVATGQIHCQPSLWRSLFLQYIISLPAGDTLNV